MSDFVVYHKAEKMGYPALKIHKLGIYTKKPVNGIKGSRVWIIAGEGSPRKYYLRATFLVGSVEPSDRIDFKSRVNGTDGQLLDPMPLLNAESWFPAFLERQGNFAFGFCPINDPAVIEALKKILLTNTLR
ncbi:MAG TPA: hypothetical protein VGM62_09630 [Chthoniobacterales bacterium]